MDLAQSLPVLGWIALHAAGLFTGWATRLRFGSRLNALTQVSFYSLLASLSCVAWYSHQLELGLWIPTGFTMVGMVLMAVTDLSGGAEAVSEEHTPAASAYLY